MSVVGAYFGHRIRAYFIRMCESRVLRSSSEYRQMCGHLQLLDQRVLTKNNRIEGVAIIDEFNRKFDYPVDPLDILFPDGTPYVTPSQLENMHGHRTNPLTSEEIRVKQDAWCEAVVEKRRRGHELQPQRAGHHGR